MKTEALGLIMKRPRTKGAKSRNSKHDKDSFTIYNLYISPNLATVDFDKGLCLANGKERVKS